MIFSKVNVSPITNKLNFEKERNKTPKSVERSFCVTEFLLSLWD